MSSNGFCGFPRMCRNRLHRFVFVFFLFFLVRQTTLVKQHCSGYSPAHPRARRSRFRRVKVVGHSKSANLSQTTEGHSHRPRPTKIKHFPFTRGLPVGQSAEDGTFCPPPGLKTCPESQWEMWAQSDCTGCARWRTPFSTEVTE